MNQIQEIQNRVFGKSKDSNIIDEYHYLMIHYGYIPFEEFKKMDANLVNELILRLNKLNEKSKGPTGRIGRKMI